MTAPNEPGYPGPGEGASNGTGPAESGGGRRLPPPTDTGEGVSRPRSAPGPRQTPPRPPEAPESRSGGHSPGVEARLNRFISGSAAPGAKATPEPAARHESSRAPEAYGSELPDLSGPTRRSAPPRKPPPDRERERDTAKPAATSRSAERRVPVAGRVRGPVRASMQLRRIDPWSALKVSLILSVSLFFVWEIAVAILYLILGSMGVWSKLNTNVGDLLNNAGGGGADLVSSGAIFGGATLIGLVNIVVFTAMATIGALVYNLTTDLIGGVEVTLADRD